LKKGNLSLRELYRTFEKPGKNKIKELHDKLNDAVIEAYGFNSQNDILQQVLDLNLNVSQNENDKSKVQKPGIPDYYTNKQNLLSTDCVCFDTNTKK